MFRSRGNAKLSQTALKQYSESKEGSAISDADNLERVTSRTTHRFSFAFLPFAYRSPFITTALNVYIADKVHVLGRRGYDRDLNVQLAWALSGSLPPPPCQVLSVRKNRLIFKRRANSGGASYVRVFILSRLRLIVPLQGLSKALSSRHCLTYITRAR